MGLRPLLVSVFALVALAAAASAAATVVPLGDGHVGSAPARGSVDACPLPSLPGGGGPPGGGAQGATPWIHGTTWDTAAKPAVQGAVHWPAASFSVTVAGASRIIRTNSLPVGAATGVFPISPSDPAYAYDRNPNSIRAVPSVWTLPRSPRVAARASCLPFGPIGVTTNGVDLYNALDAEKRDAVAHEEQDACGGHPGPSGGYHYHAASPCLHTSGTSTLVGYALDGFGIYVERPTPTDAELDACHGRTSTVLWNGTRTRVYHYVATAEYPYTLGCFRGSLGTIAGSR